MSYHIQSFPATWDRDVFLVYCKLTEQRKGKSFSYEAVEFARSTSTGQEARNPLNLASQSLKVQRPTIFWMQSFILLALTE